MTCYFATTKAVNTHSDIKFKDGDFIMFGKETKGLPEELLFANRQTCMRIPMIEQARSLNLSNSVTIAVYEALRQTGYKSLETLGQLTKYEW